MDKFRGNPTGKILEGVLALITKCLEISLKVVGWAAIVFVTLVAAILNGGKGGRNK